MAPRYGAANGGRVLHGKEACVPGDNGENMRNMINEPASETSLGSRGETAPVEDCVAGSSAVERQHTVGGSGAGGAAPRMTTATTSIETMEPTPRFLLVKKVEGDFSRDSPFFISRVIYGLIGETKDIKKVRDGLLINTVSRAQSIRLSKIKRFGDFQVEVTPHATLNYCKGVIYCRDLLNCSLDEIKDCLKNQGIIDVKRIKTKRDGVLIDSPNHIITFNSTSLPNEIKVAFYNLKVRPYIPAPLRCFRCQLFGHVAVRCNKDQICSCGKPLHEGRPCETPIVCVNCRGSHSAKSRNCPKYKKEVAIQELRTTQKLTYNEARAKINISTPRDNISYAQATQSTPSNVKQIVTQLTPEITKIVKSIIQDSRTLQNNNNQQIEIAGTFLDHRSRSVSMSSSQSRTFITPSEKRKRDTQKDLPDDTSGEDARSETSEAVSDTQREKQKKRKVGWPKGKPRKVSK